MNVVRRAVMSAYALTLRAFPAAHRDEYQSEMIESFDQGLTAHTREHGRWRAIGFAVAACLNVVSAGLGERRRFRRAGLTRTLGDVLTGFGRDLTYAARSLAKARTFSTVCVTSLGVGLGVVFAISLFMGMLFATPPGVDTDDLVEVIVNPQGPLRAQFGQWAIETWSYPDFDDVRRADTGMAVTGWAIGTGVLRSSSIAPQRVSTMYASINYFTSVGIAPALGRVFDAGDSDDASAQPVAVVSHHLWETRFDADPDIVGSILVLNRAEHVVIGVAPEEFRGHLNRRAARPVDVWVPLREHPLLSVESGVRHDRNTDWLRVHARLSPGTTLVDANRALSSIMAGLSERHASSNEHKAASVVAYTSTGTNEQTEKLAVKTLFFAAAGMVLVIVCLNVAGMMLVRSATREQELAVRQALGASRGRLASHLMAEAIVLALAGGALSLAVVHGAWATLAWWLQGPIPDELRLSPTRALACMGLSLATTLVFGLLPSVRFSRASLVTAIKDDAGGGGWRVGRMHRLAAALQVGIALPFLVLGGLLFQGARVTATADLGFEPNGLFAARIHIADGGYASEDADSFLRNVRDKLREAAGVTSVTMGDGVPLDYSPIRSSVYRDVPSARRVRAHIKRIGEGYLATLGTPLLRGRDITADDHAGAELVAVLSESLATRLFAGDDALGERVITTLQGSERGVFTVVGITADVATSQMQNSLPQIFVPLAQQPASSVFLIARAATDLDSMRTAFDETIAEFDPDFSRPTVLTGDELVRDSIGDLLQQSGLAIMVAIVALTLSSLGIYGVVAFMVGARTRELGVRIALGASRRRIVRSVLVDTCVLIAPGLVVGVLLALTAVRQMGLFWYTLGAVEPLAYTLAGTAALTVALLASLPSAFRAAAVEPMEAIRAE